MAFTAVDEFRSMVSCARTLHRIAMEYAEEGNTDQSEEYHDKAAWWLKRARDYRAFMRRKEAA